MGGASNDLIAVTGGLTLDGILNVTNSASFGLGTYRLINFGGALTNNGPGIGTTPAGFSASDLTIQTSIANQVNRILRAHDFNSGNVAKNGAARRPAPTCRDLYPIPGTASPMSSSISFANSSA